MNAIDNSKMQKDDISLGELMSVLAAAKVSPLVFDYDGRPVKPGYHVTEVKAGHFSALDCGANPEAWSEIFIQLWDIDEDDRTHMPEGKFYAIIRKVTEHVKLDDSAKLNQCTQLDSNSSGCGRRTTGHRSDATSWYRSRIAIAGPR